MVPESETDRYRRQEQLSPDGNTWLAQDLQDPARRVVLKFLPDGADIIAARHIVDHLAELASGGVAVPVDEGETAEGRPYLVYRWVEGVTLRDLMNETGTPGFGPSARILRQIGASVAALQFTTRTARTLPRSFMAVRATLRGRHRHRPPISRPNNSVGIQSHPATSSVWPRSRRRC
jgi:hypothetical protein